MTLLEGQKSSSTDPKEFMADCFAGALLMPKMAVERAFAVRNWSADSPTPAQIYVVSGYFGVGYSALVNHLWRSLRLLPSSHAENLLKVGRRRAQAQALGWDSANTAWIVDQHWNGPGDRRGSGDILQVHGESSCEGNCLVDAGAFRGERLYRACQPGIGKISSATGWSGYVRVSRRAFVGRSVFRHLSEED